MSRNIFKLEPRGESAKNPCCRKCPLKTNLVCGALSGFIAAKTSKINGSSFIKALFEKCGKFVKAAKS